MNTQQRHWLIRLALKALRWYCRPELIESVEGDLLERFHKWRLQYGDRKAKGLFLKEVVYLFRPGTVKNIFHLPQIFADMKTKQWLQLIAFNMLVVVCIFLPFLPGRYDRLVMGISGVAQLTGFAGLLLVPVGILWLIQEIKKITGRPVSNNWHNGYYYAVTACCIGVLFVLLLTLTLWVAVGLSAGVIALSGAVYLFYRLSIAIRKLKKHSAFSFNATPLYLLSIPLIAFTVRLFLIEPASSYSRDHAIRQAQKAIGIIEQYHDQHHRYPESLDQFYDLPRPSVMGIDQFIYERNGDGYNLSFVQWQHFGATREVVMYNKEDRHNVKGHFASYDVQQLHWRYYWLD